MDCNNCFDLFDAIKLDHDECLIKLIKSGHSLLIKNSTFQNPIHYACQIGSPKCLKLLILFGADTNKKDDNMEENSFSGKPPIYGKPPLYYAYTFKNYPCADILLKYGADDNEKYDGQHIKILRHKK